MYWEDAIDQVVPQEDLGGLLRRLADDSGSSLVPSGLDVALSVDDLPTHGSYPP